MKEYASRIRRSSGCKILDEKGIGITETGICMLHEGIEVKSMMVIDVCLECKEKSCRLERNKK